MMKKRLPGTGWLWAGILYFFLGAALLSCGGGSSGPDTPADNDATSVGTSGFSSSPPVACDDGAAAPSGHTYYLDPINGRISNDGSAGTPWPTLQEVVENHMIETRAYADLPYDGSNALVTKNPGAPVKAGDTLVLLNGYHGEFVLQGAYNEYPITVKAARRPTPHPIAHPPVGSSQVAFPGADGLPLGGADLCGQHPGHHGIP